ncbi:MAG: DinB family protein [Dehalococcoidia bacterium]
MTRVAIAALLYLLDEAFSGDGPHSFLANLESVTPELWPRRPDGGERSIREIAYHAGVAKFLHANHLFGDASLTYGDLMRSATMAGDSMDMDRAIAWLREGHRVLRDGVAGLSDGELTQLRRSPWGEVREVRRGVAAMIEHDVYHAGEINHIRALLQGDDGWSSDLV